MIILKNKTTGEILPVEGANKKVHRDGRILGTYGFEEEEGAFETSFEETDTHFIGNPVRNCLIQKEKECFSKEEWEVKLREGDDVISIHIPKGTDLSPEFVAASTASALKFVEKYYDEFHPKGFMCSSWLLEPSIEAILGKPGKISGFGNQFVRYPNKSVGKEMFSFVFGPGAAQRPWEELAEDTSLQRALKELYLSGKRIYAWSGILI